MNNKRPVVCVPDPTVLEPYERVKDILDIRFGRTDKNYTKEELKEFTKDAAAIVATSRYPIDKEIIENAPNLKIIAKGGAKPSPVMIDINTATEKGIYVTFTPGSTTVCVAEHTIMLMLCLLKETFPIMNKLKNGMWRTEIDKVSETYHKKIGIVGFGQIGHQTARRLEPWDCDVYFYDPFIVEGEFGAKKTTLDFIIENCDIILLHSGVTEETYHMFSEEQFRRMKKTAYLVNTSRGALIHEPDLIKALNEHWIAGAALDVFEDEPPKKDNPLFSMPNVIVTAHTASWTVEALTRSCEESIENILRVIHHETPTNTVNGDLIK